MQVNEALSMFTSARKIQSNLLRLMLALFISLLFACGGGGGSSAPAASQPPAPGETIITGQA